MTDWATEQEETLRRMSGAGNYNAWLLERAEPYLGSRVLDAGAGTGTFTELLAERAEHVIALEPEAEFAAILHRRFDGRAGIEIVDLDATKLEPDALGGPVDAIVCFNVLEHIADDRAALERYRDCLAPGGSLLLLVPAHPTLYGEIDRVLQHERRYTAAGLRAVLRRTGFEIRELRAVNPVGAAGWLVTGRVLKRDQIPSTPLKTFDLLVPALRALDRLRLPFGLSLWAVARRP